MIKVPWIGIPLYDSSITKGFHLWHPNAPLTTPFPLLIRIVATHSLLEVWWGLDDVHTSHQYGITAPTITYEIKRVLLVVAQSRRLPSALSKMSQVMSHMISHMMSRKSQLSQSISLIPLSGGQFTNTPETVPARRTRTSSRSRRHLSSWAIAIGDSSCARSLLIT